MNYFEKTENIGRIALEKLINTIPNTKLEFTPLGFCPVDAILQYLDKKSLIEIKVRSNLYNEFYLETIKLDRINNYSIENNIYYKYYVNIIIKQDYIDYYIFDLNYVNNRVSNKELVSINKTIFDKELNCYRDKEFYSLPIEESLQYRFYNNKYTSQITSIPNYCK